MKLRKYPIFFTCILAALHIAAIYVFTSGFFLTRYELSDTSMCDILPRKDLSQNWTHDLNGGCWFPRTYKKVIIILIDALRFDFTEWLDTNSNDLPFYRNKLPIIKELLNKEPENSKLFRFWADPPTTTMQRLKGSLTTGGLPTFIDIHDNFQTSQIFEDNIIDQLASISKTLVFMGDDTWTQLYPHSFNHSYPFPSFNVYDLHTVDNGCFEHLIPEIRRDNWDLIVSHFLGVDHVGHRYQDDHIAMQSKLGQVNKLITDLIQEQKTIEDSLLLVFGDHGMTSTGDHGGSSDNEVAASLFVHSSKPVFSSIFNSFNIRPTMPFGEHLVVNQIDLVPTLSLIMGIPIPFSNLGSVIPELFINNLEQKSNFDTLSNLARALYINSWQVFRYLQFYSTEAQALPAETLVEISSKLNQVTSLHEDIISRSMKGKRFTGSYVEITQLQKVIREYFEFLKFVVDMCREKWVNFNLFEMYSGIFLFGLTFFLLIGFLINQSLNLILSKNILPFLSIAIFGGIIPIIAYRSLYLPNIILFSSLSLLISITLYSFNSYSSLIQNIKLISYTSIFGSLSLLVYSLGLFSNSFIITEQKVLIYLIASCTLVILFDKIRYKDTKFNIIITFSIPFLCRIMGDGSDIMPDLNSTDEFWEISFLLKLFISFVLLYTMLVFCYIKTRKNENTQIFKIYFYIILPIQFIFNSLYWIGHNYNMSYANLFAQISYIISILSLFCLMIFQSSAILNSITLISIFTLPICLVLGPNSPIVILFAYITYFAIIYTGNTTISIFLYWLVSQRLFYALGHNDDFSAIKIQSAFIGFSQYKYFRSAIIVALNTYSSEIISLFAIFLTRLYQNVYNITLYESLYKYLSIRLLFAFLGSISTTIHSRHLMVWAIFAPKFIFTVVALLVADVIVIFLSLFHRDIIKTKL